MPTTQPTTVQPDTTIAPDDLAVRMVRAGQCLLPLNPPPTSTQIEHIIEKLGDAFSVPAELRMAARLMWEIRAGRRAS